MFIYNQEEVQHKQRLGSCQEVEREREPEGGYTYVGCTHSFMQVPAITSQEDAT
jgi:hypothetical protein